MIRSIISVATPGPYQKGLARLRAAVPDFNEKRIVLNMWDGGLPRGCPPHSKIPYAMKAYALRDAAMQGADLLLWCDSSVVPVRSMEPLWERIERDGYWISHNGFTNYEWTADSAYAALFPEAVATGHWEEMREINRRIPHVLATAFGLNARHEKGRTFLNEYFRLASETAAFCGPWINTNYPGSNVGRGGLAGSCGPPDVKGHRHDQTAASVLAWRLGFNLTSPPDLVAYPSVDGKLDERTILLIDGSVNA